MNAWLKNVSKIKRDFSHADLKLTQPFKLCGINHIEAGFDNQYPERELSRWQSSTMCSSMISYHALDAKPDMFQHKLALYMLFNGFVGIRDITEGEDAHRLNSIFVLENLSVLASNQLIYEAQFELENQNAVTIICEYAQQLPNLKIVLNHAGLPKPITV